MVTTQRDIDTEPPVNAEELLGLARQVRVPVLIMRGEQSDVVTDEGVQELEAVLPASSVVVVGGAGHMVAGDDNDVFSKAVSEFLDGLD